MRNIKEKEDREERNGYKHIRNFLITATETATTTTENVYAGIYTHIHTHTYTGYICRYFFVHRTSAIRLRFRLFSARFHTHVTTIYANGKAHPHTHTYTYTYTRTLAHHVVKTKQEETKKKITKKRE